MIYFLDFQLDLCLVLLLELLFDFISFVFNNPAGNKNNTTKWNPINKPAVLKFLCLALEKKNYLWVIFSSEQLEMLVVKILLLQNMISALHHEVIQ